MTGPSPAETSDPILLGGYAAKQCPVRVQNDYSPLVAKVTWVPTPEQQARLDAGIVFEARAFERLIDLHPGIVVIDHQLGKAGAIATTVAAMDAEAPLILGGWLPDDPEGGRKGKPDVLIRVEGGYLPGDVKNHHTVKRALTTRVVVSPLSDPGAHVELAAWTPTEHRYEDGLQLAHYTRMLQTCGRHPGTDRLWGAVLGTSQPELVPGSDADFVFVWHDLTKAIGSTFSRTSGKTSRSLLERYDHEHGFRIKVADTARYIVGDSDDPRPLVEPVGQTECGSCPYEAWCAEQMVPDDPSTAINIGRLSPREWLTLRRMGIATTAALSAVDVDDALFFDEYFPEVRHLGPTMARKRLEAAVERAQMICDGISVTRLDGGPIDVPTADIEIDVDIEFDIEGTVYMWGARVRHGGDESTAVYVSDFVEWGPLDGPSERELARRFTAWLRAQREAAEAAGESLQVFHWSHPERSRLRSILGEAEVEDLIGSEAGLFVDLEKVFKSTFFSLHGSSIKKVAPQFGFRWHASDPGGATSQLYLAEVRANPGTEEAAAAKRWLLTYNEDDNAAMATIRDGMREWKQS